MSTTTRLITVAEYDTIPDPPGGRYELRHGELVFMSFVKKPHARVQRNVLAALLARCGEDGEYYPDKEMACRPLPEYELWSIDVALTTTIRWNVTDRWLAGSPELCIEVLSPSNTKREMDDRRETLFRGGCQQFWIIDIDSRTVNTYAADGAMHTYRATDSIPLEPFSNLPLTVAEIFAGLG
jgi:Uma2 family endonuclease